MTTKRGIVILVLSLQLIQLGQCAEEQEPEIIKEDNQLNSTQEEDLYDAQAKRAWSYLRTTPKYFDYSHEDVKKTLKELDQWTAPDHIIKGFPYYLSGYDHEDRPIWIAEGGKYDFRGVSDRREQEILNKYCLQAAYNIMKSLQVNDSPGREIKEAVFLIDMDSFDFIQMNPPTLQLYLLLARTYQYMLAEVWGGAVIINANYVVEGLINILRPVLGRILERVEIHGTNRVNWTPKLQKHFPRESLPSWYGGAKDFEPLAVHG